SFVTCWDILPCSGLLSSDVGWYNRTGWKWVVATWDLQPCAPVSEGVASGGRRAQVTNLEQKGKTVGQRNPFLGVVCGGTGVCSSLTSWSVRGAGWFCLWALDLVESSFASALLEFLLLWLLFEFIAYLTGLNSNPSGSSDPWVAAQPSGVLGEGPEG
ncbi:hypothetical protein Taro_051193, partial [Colocasia esculenta]|nr:hypothetical protein [Colocasia esculenta]